MGARRIRREQRREDMAESRHRNGIRKAAERERRDARMLETVRKGKLPYTPPVMSWLSSKLDKRSSLITQNEVDNLVSSH
jgi:hypothetical protein